MNKKFKMPFNAEDLKKMKEVEIVEDLDKLSILTGFQAELTAQLNKTPQSDLVLVGTAANALGRAMGALKTTMSLPMWQRAAWEARQQAQAPMASANAIQGAEGLWMAVQFLQAMHLNSITWVEKALADQAEAES